MGGFVHASDWHLSRLTWQHRPRLTGDSFYALRQIVDFCIPRRAELYAAGDLFDKDRPDSAAVAEMCEQMYRMQQAGLCVRYIQGQHELASPPWMSVHAWTDHLDNKVLSIDGVAGKIAGLDWRPRERFEQDCQALFEGRFDEIRFLLAHQVWLEHMGETIVTPEASLSMVPGAEYVLSGDYHQHQIKEFPTARGPRYLVSPGSISIRNLAEPPQKAFWYFDPVNSRFVSVPLKCRPFVRTTINSLDDIEAIAQRVFAPNDLPEEIKVPIVALRYPPSLPDAFQRITERFEGCHLWLEEVATVENRETIVLDPAVVAASSVPDLIRASVPDEQLRDDLVELTGSVLPPAEAVRNYVVRLTDQVAKDAHAAGAAGT